MSSITLLGDYPAFHHEDAVSCICLSAFDLGQLLLLLCDSVETAAEEYFIISLTNFVQNKLIFFWPVTGIAYRQCSERELVSIKKLKLLQIAFTL